MTTDRRTGEPAAPPAPEATAPPLAPPVPAEAPAAGGPGAGGAGRASGAGAGSAQDRGTARANAERDAALRSAMAEGPTLGGSAADRPGAGEAGGSSGAGGSSRADAAEESPGAGTGSAQDRSTTGADAEHEGARGALAADRPAAHGTGGSSGAGPASGEDAGESAGAAAAGPGGEAASPGEHAGAADGDDESGDVAAPGEGSQASSDESDEGESAEGQPHKERRRLSAEEAASVGSRLGGQAAELLAAVRAVESGERSAGSFYSAPPAGARRAEGPRSARPTTGGAPTPGPGTASTERTPATPGGAPLPPGAGTAAPGAQAAPTTGAAMPPGTAAAAPGTTAAAATGAQARPAAEAPAPPMKAAGAGLPQADLGAIRRVLADGGAPEALAPQVAAALGERAAEALREDPWQLLAVPGVRPDQADGFARAVLGPACGPGDDRRAQALIRWLLERAALDGHTALEPSALSAALAQRSVPDPERAIHTAIADGGVLVFQDALEAGRGAADAENEEPPVRVLLGLDRYALAEESLADGLARLLSTFVPEGEDGRRAWEGAAAAAPSPSAAELIRTAANSGLVVHTGAEAARAEPAALVAAARSLGLRAYAAAHSEDGRGRLAELIGDAAVTVAGLLAGSEGPGRDEEGGLALDVLAVLDAPQLDVESAAMLVESLPDGARLVLSGDPGVLWSAGPGRVFADVLAARVCPQVASRTPDPGPIGELVSGIGIGELTPVEAPGKEVVIVPVREAGEAVHRTVQLVADSVPRAIGVPADRTQVITPAHGGAAGTRALNAALKERLNPGPGRFAGFDPGDRVVYVPAPGRTLPGTVVSADSEGLHLDCAGTAVVVPRERVGDTVRHGWALTAHQAAGTRWPAAVVVLPGDAANTLTRPWVYTAFSRGERHLSVVHGVEQALPRAVAEAPARERTTRLRTLLRTLVPPAA